MKSTWSYINCYEACVPSALNSRKSAWLRACAHIKREIQTSVIVIWQGEKSDRGTKRDVVSVHYIYSNDSSSGSPLLLGLIIVVSGRRMYAWPHNARPTTCS